MRLCASQWKDAKAAGTTGGQTWPQFLAQCRASRSAAASPSGGFAPAPAPAASPCPAPASQSGSLFPWWQPSAHAPASNRRSFGPASGRVHDRASGACDLPVRPGRVGQHADGRLPLFGNPLLRAHTQGRLYVRSQCAGERISRGAELRNVRPRRLRAEGAAHGRRRALTEQLVSGHRLFPPIALTASFDARAAALFTDEICPAERTRRVVIERQNYQRRCVTRLTVRHAQFMPNSLSPR